jgi:chromosome segregation ATPase
MIMWHLAQVKKKDLEGKAQLQLLAQQKAEHAWTVMTEDNDLCIDNSDDHLEGALLLIELTASRQVQKVQDATPWILEVIEQYLGVGVTPAILQEEVQRAEQWRQSLTLKSQELQRRALEMEARREQIQELEENLKQEKEKLETLAAQLKANSNGLEAQEDSAE